MRWEEKKPPETDKLNRPGSCFNLCARLGGSRSFSRAFYCMAVIIKQTTKQNVYGTGGIIL